jgi:hypothetical protein
VTAVSGLSGNSTRMSVKYTETYGSKNENIIELTRITVSIPPRKKLQLKEEQIRHERIDIGNIPVHLQATTPAQKWQFVKDGKGMEKVQSWV